MPIRAPWQHEIAKFDNRGLDLIHPVDQVDAQHYSRFTNVKSVQEGSLQPRPGSSLVNTVAIDSPAPITANLLASATDETDSNSYTTVSVAPAANNLILCCVEAVDFNLDQSITVDTVTGNGLTWVEVIEKQFRFIAATRSTISVFRALGTAPTAGIITATLSQVAAIGAIIVVEFAGIDDSGVNGVNAIVQSVSNTVDNDTSLTVTLAAFASALNATFGFFAVNAAAPQPFTPGTGFTELAETSGTSQQVMAEFRNDNDTTVDATTAGIGAIAAIGIELKRNT